MSTGWPGCRQATRRAQNASALPNRQPREIGHEPGDTRLLAPVSVTAHGTADLVDWALI